MTARPTRGGGPLRYPRMDRRLHDFGAPHERGGLRTFWICLLSVLAAVACVLLPAGAKAATAADVAASAPRYALVVQDGTPLRAAARGGGTPLAMLGQGELLELRGTRMDYLQVWDPRRERGGFVRTGFLRPLTLQPAEAPELLALLRFLRDRPGSEALGLGVAAAYLKAAPAGTISAESFDAMGMLAERLAWRANAAAAAATTSARPGESAVAAQLEVAAGLGVHFDSVEREDGVTLCYDGDAFRHVLALSPTPEQAARAALALTRHDCIAPLMPPLQRWQLDQSRAAVLTRVTSAAGADLPAYVRNRLRLREAGVWSAIAFEDSRRLVVEGTAPTAGLPAVSAADVLQAGNRALDALAGIDSSELADDDQSAYTEAAMRVGAARWAAEPVVAPAGAGLRVATRPGEPGQTCVLLLDAKHAAANPLASRCTFATVWTASARANANGSALALAVQPLATWRELWVFQSTPAGWTVQVLPPSTQDQGVGYVEFAGWVPGTDKLLAAREVRDAAHGNRAVRSYELLDGRTLATERSADAPGSLNAFARWQDPAWKRVTVSLR